MAREGNSTKYSILPTANSIKSGGVLFQRPLNVAYDRGKATSFANESIKGKDVAAHSPLADMTATRHF